MRDRDMRDRDMVTRQDLDAAVAQALVRVASVDSVQDLKAVDQELLGKSSFFAEASRAIGRLDPSDRKEAGRRLQEARTRLEQALAERYKVLSRLEREKRLSDERMDLSEIMLAARPDGQEWVAASLGSGLVAAGALRPDKATEAAVPAVAHVGAVLPPGQIHLVQRTRDELEDVFVGMGFVVVEGPEVETDWYNFEALNIPPAHPARGMWDTFYLDLGDPETLLLRTHTSPVQVRLMQSQPPPLFAVMPGRCYRRDTPDARHLPSFHQVEGLVVDRGISFADLAGTIETFTTAYFGPDIHSRLRPAYFPFTEPSAEFEVTCTICRGDGCRTCSHTGWIELGGCGMVDPAVFASVGLDPEEWTGLAFGFGIDRCAQMRHEIPDMRSLLDNDVRFLTRV